MKQNKTLSSSWPLLMIACALAGAGISYHFTLESRFTSIEQKLDQNSAALQQYQASQDAIFSAKTETLNNLSKEVETLQSSLQPLGKTTREQTDSLSQIHQQIAALQQSQQAQEDAQKRLSSYTSQLEKTRHRVQVQSEEVTTPAPSVSAPADASANVSDLPITPTSAPHPASHASSFTLPLPPRSDSAIDLRPAHVTDVSANAPTRALPVARAVALSSDLR